MKPCFQIPYGAWNSVIQGNESQGAVVSCQSILGTAQGQKNTTDVPVWLRKHWNLSVPVPAAQWQSIHVILFGHHLQELSQDLRGGKVEDEEKEKRVERLSGLCHYYCG